MKKNHVSGKISKISAYILSFLLIFMVGFTPVFAESSGAAILSTSTTDEAIASSEENAKADADTSSIGGILEAERSDIASSIATESALSVKEVDLLEESGVVVPGELLLVMPTVISESVIVEEEDSISEVVQIGNGQKMIKIETDEKVSEAIEFYDAEPNVLYAQPNFLYTLMEEETTPSAIYPLADPNDPSFSSQWALLSTSSTEVNQAWTFLDTLPVQPKVRVGVIDTGIQPDHPDLVGNLNVALSKNYIYPERPLQDTDGHGTHVAGIVSAVSNNGTGVAGVSNNKAEIISYGVFHDKKPGDSAGIAYTSDIVTAFIDAKEDGCRIINMSFGGYGALDAWDQLLNQNITVAFSEGIITVAAAGNANESKPSYPSDFEKVVSVTATDKYDARASFSDHNEFKDIAAPGVSIRSTMPGSSYGDKSGTSMAAPYICGVLALELHAKPTLNAQDAVSNLYSTATDFGPSGRDDYYGYGLVNAQAAVRAAKEQNVFTVSFNANGGTVSPSSKQIAVGDAIGTLPTPVRSGYLFAGWWTNATGGTQINESTPITGSVTFYAHWNTTVSFNANGGTVSPSSKQIAVGDVVGTLPTPVRSGYLFTGWWTSATGGRQIDTSTPITAPVTFYARWNTTVTFNANGGTVSPSSKQIAVGDAVGILPTPVRSGFLFAGWWTNTTGGTQINESTLITGSATFHARWASITATVSSDQSAIIVNGLNLFVPGSTISQLQVAVWGTANGQNDLRWYTATNNGNGNYTLNVPVSNHNETGVYNLHVYATLANGQSVLMSATTATIAPPTATVEVVSTNPATGAFQLRVKGVTSPFGVSKVEVPIWSSNNGQDDLRWYTAARQGDGSYLVNVNVLNHKSDFGVYNAHVYITSNNGIASFAAATSLTIAPPVRNMSAVVNGSGTTITANLSSTFYAPGISQLQVAVWGNANGQNDLRWYTATNNGNGNYTLNVPVSNHNETGVYNLHAYATLANGQSVFMGATTATIAPPTATVEVVSTNPVTGAFQLRVKGVTSPFGVSKVEVPIWSSNNGQDDLRWYTAVKQSEGIYLLNVSVLNHKSDFGVYNAHVYITSNNGIASFAAATSLTITPPVRNMSAVVNGSGTTITANLSSTFYAPGISQLQIAVWGTVNGQNDLRWYAATNNGNGNYVLNVPVSNHNETGVYNLHAYATLANGQSVFMGATTATIAPPTATVEIVSTNPATGAFQLRVKGVTSPFGVSKVEVPIWSSNNGQDDLRWYAAVKQSEGVYLLNVSVLNHKSDFGVYNAHVYITSNNGIASFAAATSLTIAPPTRNMSAVVNGSGTTITANLSSTFYAPGISQLQIAVWGNANGQNDLRWYTATNNGNGSYTLNVPVSNHNEKGVYNLHAYATLANGQQVFLSATAVEVK